MVQTLRRNLTDLERELNLALAPALAHRAGAVPRAIAMSDTARGVAPERLLRGLPAGGALILRHRDAAALAALARRLVPVARRLKRRLLISGDAVLAGRVGADGVHLPEALLRRRPALARARPRPGWIVTASAHGPMALRLADQAGVDAVLLSPVWATESHPARPPLGVLRFAALCRAVRVPVLALGGVDRAGLRRLKRSGLRGVAGIGLFIGAQ